MEITYLAFRVAAWIDRTTPIHQPYESKINLYLVPGDRMLGDDESQYCVITDVLAIPEDKFNTAKWMFERNRLQLTQAFVDLLLSSSATLNDIFDENGDLQNVEAMPEDWWIEVPE